MKRLNARGTAAANKMLVLAATVYNLKKWLRFNGSKTAIMAQVQTKYRKGYVLITHLLLQLILSLKATPTFSVCKMCCEKKEK